MKTQIPKLSENQKFVLIGMLKDIENNLEFDTSVYGFGPQKIRKADALTGLVRTNPSGWFPFDRRPDKNQVSSIYKELAAMGLVIRLGQFLQFTETGREVAQSLLERDMKNASTDQK